jgi:hypothetical protein
VHLKKIPFIVLVTLGVYNAGCGSGGHSGGGSLQPPVKAAPPPGTGTPAPPTTSSPAALPPTVTRASYANVASNGVVSPGDTITVSFSTEVVVTSGSSAAGAFQLPVTGDTLGAGATIAPGTQRTDVVITIGSSPSLRVSGTFDPAAVSSYSSSGIDVAPGATIADAKGHRALPSLAVDIDGPLTERWRVAATLNFPRGLHTATALDDGRILIVGGECWNWNRTAAPICTESEIFDPLAGSITLVSALSGKAGYMTVTQVDSSGATFDYPVGRAYHTATRLETGEVLICGGYGTERIDSTGHPIFEDLRTAHVFDPKTNAFRIVAPVGTTTPSLLNDARQNHSAVLLATGKVLVCGGQNNLLVLPQPATTVTYKAYRSAELFDPSTNLFTPVFPNEMVEPRDYFVIGYDRARQRALVLGGAVHWIPVGSTGASGKYYFTLAPGAEMYEDTMLPGGSFVPCASPAVDYRFQAGDMLDTGDLLSCGGSDEYGAITSQVQMFSTRTGTFPSVGNLAQARVRHQAVALGHTLVVAGGVAGIGTSGTTLASVETYDADTKTFRSGPDMQNRRYGHSLTASGPSVYAVGGIVGVQYDFRTFSYVVAFNGLEDSVEVFERP